jgi:hypothetical protein
LRARSFGTATTMLRGPVSGALDVGALRQAERRLQAGQPRHVRREHAGRYPVLDLVALGVKGHGGVEEQVVVLGGRWGSRGCACECECGCV